MLGSVCWLPGDVAEWDAETALFPERSLCISPGYAAQTLGGSEKAPRGGFGELADRHAGQGARLKGLVARRINMTCILAR